VIPAAFACSAMRFPTAVDRSVFFPVSPASVTVRSVC